MNTTTCPLHRGSKQTAHSACCAAASAAHMTELGVCTFESRLSKDPSCDDSGSMRHGDPVGAANTMPLPPPPPPPAAPPSSAGDASPPAAGAGTGGTGTACSPADATESRSVTSWPSSAAAAVLAWLGSPQYNASSMSQEWTRVKPVDPEARSGDPAVGDDDAVVTAAAVAAADEEEEEEEDVVVMSGDVAVGDAAAAADDDTSDDEASSSSPLPLRPPSSRFLRVPRRRRGGGAGGCGGPGEEAAGPYSVSAGSYVSERYSDTSLVAHELYPACKRLGVVFACLHQEAVASATASGEEGDTLTGTVSLDARRIDACDAVVDDDVYDATRGPVGVRAGYIYGHAACPVSLRAVAQAAASARVRFFSEAARAVAAFAAAHGDAMRAFLRATHDGGRAAAGGCGTAAAAAAASERFAASVELLRQAEQAGRSRGARGSDSCTSATLQWAAALCELRSAEAATGLLRGGSSRSRAEALAALWEDFCGDRGLGLGCDLAALAGGVAVALRAHSFVGRCAGDGGVGQLAEAAVPLDAVFHSADASTPDALEALLRTCAEGGGGSGVLVLDCVNLQASSAAAAAESFAHAWGRVEPSLRPTELHLCVGAEGDDECWRQACAPGAGVAVAVRRTGARAAALELGGALVACGGSAADTEAACVTLAVPTPPLDLLLSQVASGWEWKRGVDAYTHVHELVATSTASVLLRHAYAGCV
eukprot:Rhum_TRINITY_DN14611_c6_g1::Rhum_TRINITY_DN14611_c6_g1_i1::g.103359::m.103359